MIDEIALRRDIDLANKAKTLLENDAFVTVLNHLDVQYTAAWRMTATHDYEGRENCWHAIQALADVRAKLQRAIDNGIVASAELKAIEPKTGDGW